MTAEIITMPGIPAPAAPPRAAERDLNDPRNWIEPAPVGKCMTNLRPHIVVIGGFAHVMFAGVEPSLYGEPAQAVVEVKVVLPADMLESFASAFARAAGGTFVRDVSANDGGKT